MAVTWWLPGVGRRGAHVRGWPRCGLGHLPWAHLPRGLWSAHSCAWARPHADVSLSSKGGTVLFLLCITRPPANPHSVLDAERHTQAPPTLGWTAHRPAPSARGLCPRLSASRRAALGGLRLPQALVHPQEVPGHPGIPGRAQHLQAPSQVSDPGSPGARARRRALPARSSGPTE